MSRKYPPEFNQLVKDPNVRGAFVSVLDRRHPKECPNCGGIGTLIIFLATAGPLLDPPGSPAIAKFVNDNWWAGMSDERACPICKGTGIDPKFKQPRTHHHQLDMEGVVKDTPKMDYTDV